VILFVTNKAQLFIHLVRKGSEVYAGNLYDSIFNYQRRNDVNNNNSSILSKE